MHPNCFIQSPFKILPTCCYLTQTAFLCRHSHQLCFPASYTRATLDDPKSASNANSVSDESTQQHLSPSTPEQDQSTQISDIDDLQFTINEPASGETLARQGISSHIDQPSKTDSQILDNDSKIPGDSIDTLLPADNTWYSITKSIAKPDTHGTLSGTADGKEKALDLRALDDAGRQVLAKGSYGSVVDVDVDDGGVLEEDEDNNNLFSGVGLDALIENDMLIDNLRTQLGIITATHVQLAAIPRILEKCDMVMQSYTGTGKTLAFLLPILDEMDTNDDTTHTIVVAPTRELAMQIMRECEKLTVGMDIRSQALIGGANPARQVERLRKATPHIVIGTPGRLAELAETGDLRARRVETLVVDEVDQCLIGEFGEQVRRLLKEVPRGVQKILVSATGDVDGVRTFAGELLRTPVLLRVGGVLRVPRNIIHWMCVVPSRLKIDTVRKLMFTDPQPERAIIFVDDPRRVDIVGERLWQMRIAVGALRGNAHKTERKEVLDAFRKGKIRVLVSTEVAARGLDVKEITHVINLDLPTDSDHYVHRAGRCGRVGKPGAVISIATSENAFVLKRMSKEMGVEIRRMEPRNGEYRDPVERSPNKRKHVQAIRDNDDMDDNNRNNSSLKQGMNSKKMGSRNEIRSNVQLKDGRSPRNRALGMLKNESEKRGSDEGKIRVGGKMSGGKLKKKEKRNNEKNNKREKVKPEKSEKVTPREQRIASLVAKRQRQDIKKRAVLEGWVGNRPKSQGGN